MINERPDIDKILHPRGVALYGASPKGGLGNLLMQGLIELGFPNIYPIHPKVSEILGLKAYHNINEINDPVDLVIVAVQPKNVRSIILDAIIKKVKGIVLFTAGFREIGESGKKYEKEIVKLAKDNGIRIIGPNCMGIYCPESKLSFFPSLPSEKGATAFVSQSGSLSTLVILNSMLKGINFSKVISVGNCADLDFIDFLEYLANDSETKVIGCYLEGIDRAKEFINLAREITKKKPVIVWKVGKTEGGLKAAKSHTGSIGGNFRIWNHIFNQAGLIQVNNLNQLIEHFGLLQNPSLPKGNRVVIISGPGGPAVSSADACELEGLKLAELTQETKDKLKEILPEFGTGVNNPVDLGLNIAFQPELEHIACEIAGSDPNVDMLLIYISVLKRIQVKNFIKIQNKIKKPIALVTAFDVSISFKEYTVKDYFRPLSPSKVPKYLKQLYSNGISLHISEQNAAKALSNLLRYAKYLKKNANK
ncbi:MAG: acetate--CoA ligase family protein [Candidatus Helarchaeota archaeon]